MTTNARDEKWSEWWPNRGVQPNHKTVEVKFDDGSTDIDDSDMYFWPIDGDSCCDIIAYRYKIKEPESDGGWTPEAIKAAAFSTPEEDEAWQAKEREQSKSDGMKYDSDKPAMDLIPPYMEEEVGMVLAFGAQKYAPDNWRKVTPLRSRYLAAAQRHINALKKGEQMDPESGLHHAAHAVCCLMFLGEVELEPLK